MPEKKLQKFHFTLVEDLLPVGMAIFNRAKNGGADGVLEGFVSSDHPIEHLRDEGRAPAKSIREKLDQIRPGLGNPAFEVQVNQNHSEITEHDKRYDETLVDILSRIDDRLSLMQSFLNKINISNS